DYQGVRGDEADALLVLWWNVRFRRDPCRLRDRRLFRPQSTSAVPLRPPAAIMGLSFVVPRVRCARRHLAVAYLGTYRPRRSAHGGLDVACRHRNETGLLCGAARRDESLSGRIPNVEQMDCRPGCDWNCLCGSGGAPPA